jgi:putative SOS response-associated peptidase YedK
VCGRYDLIADTPALLDSSEVQPRYSIAPSRDVPIVRGTGNSPELALAR